MLQFLKLFQIDANISSLTDLNITTKIYNNPIADYDGYWGKQYNNQAVAEAENGGYERANDLFTLSANHYERAYKRNAIKYENQAKQMRENYALFLLKWADDLRYEGDLIRAQSVIDSALILSPNNALLKVKKAAILNSQNRLSEALKLLKTAQDEQGSDSVLNYALNKSLLLEEEIASTSNALYKRYEDQTKMFLIDAPHYEGAIEPQTLLAYFDEARTSVSARLGLDSKIPLYIKLLPLNLFTKLSNSPAWAEGVFDGRLLLNIDYLGRGIKGGEDIVWHEYTHVLLERKVKSKMPVWFHEGLAQVMEPNVVFDDRERQMLAEKITTTTLLDLSDESFADLKNRNLAENAYIVSKYFVADELMEDHKTERIKTLLIMLDGRTDFDSAVMSVYGKTVAELFEDWRQKFSFK